MEIWLCAILFSCVSPAWARVNGARTYTYQVSGCVTRVGAGKCTHTSDSNVSVEYHPRGRG